MNHYVFDMLWYILLEVQVDFQNNLNVKRQIFNDMEDYLFDEVDEKLSADTIEQITETAWNIAVQNKDML